VVDGTKEHPWTSHVDDASPRIVERGLGRVALALTTVGGIQIVTVAAATAAMTTTIVALTAAVVIAATIQSGHSVN
jgi:hypothetical protein